MDATTTIQMPADWLETEGEDVPSGPGHTRWRKWPQETSVLVALSHSTFESSQEAIIGRVVGLYLMADKDIVLGLLLRKHLKAGWSTEDKLVLFSHISALVDLDKGHLIAGNVSRAITDILQSIHDQLDQSRVSTAEGMKSEDKYLKSTLAFLSQAPLKLGRDDVANLINNLVSANSRVISRMRTAMLSSN